MKKVFIWGGFFLISILTKAQEMAPRAYNFYSFASTKSDASDELKKLVPASYHAHPEFGVLPYNAPCSNCYELIDKRTDSTRMFVEKGSEGTKFYSQAAYGKIHYTDADGNLIAYDPRIKPIFSGVPVFTSNHQEYPIKIDGTEKYTSFTLPDGDLVKFNRNVHLIHVSNSGTQTNLGEANWSQMTAGDDGLRITDAWPGIDIELKVALGQVKTDYIVKSNPGFADGHLVFRDEFEADGEFELEMHDLISVVPETGAKIGTVKFLNEDEEGVYIETAFGYDQSGIRENSLQFGYKMTDENLELWVPVSWINDPDMQYPLIIDPSVTSSATYTAGIMRFRINGSWCVGPNADCSYVLTVPRPANSTLTGATFSIVHETLVGSCFFSCWMSDAGFYFSTSCGVNGYWGCNTDAPGTCTGTNLAFDNLVTCLGPACSGNVNFTIFNSYCYCNTGGNCTNSCQRINNNTWIVTIAGTTLETLANTVTGSGSQTINDADCIGTALLDPTASGGVPGYTYSWSTGATTPTVTVGVTPAIYTCTVTDACGVSRVATFNIGCPLSAMLDHFSATAAEKGVVLNWNVLTESGIEKYRIQRSDDGIHYTSILEQSASGASESASYNLRDDNPLKGLAYYRLVLVYDSGAEDYSDPVAVLTGSDDALTIVPNPSDGKFDLIFATDPFKTCTVEILTLAGTLVYKTDVLPETSVAILTLAPENLPADIYTVRITTSGKVISNKLVIR